jgi:hypothetical protein
LFATEATEIFGSAKPRLNNFGHPQGWYFAPRSDSPSDIGSRRQEYLEACPSTKEWSTVQLAQGMDELPAEAAGRDQK